MRIGLYGGTFDPIHNGHIQVANQVFRKLELDKLLFIVAYQPQLKQSPITPAEVRYTAVAKLIQHYPNYQICDVELQRSNATYTIDTVHELKTQYPDDELYFITGADVLKTLKSWKNISELVKMINFTIVSRPKYAVTLHELQQLAQQFVPDLSDKIQLLEIEALDISSTRLRG